MKFKFRGIIGVVFKRVSFEIKRSEISVLDSSNDWRVLTHEKLIVY